MLKITFTGLALFLLSWNIALAEAELPETDAEKAMFAILGGTKNPENIKTFTLKIGDVEISREYEIVGKDAVVDGDIIIESATVVEELRAFSSIEEIEKSTALDDIKKSTLQSKGLAIASAFSGKARHWKDATIPYQISGEVTGSLRNAVIKAMDHWEDKTIVRFVERTAANKNQYPDFVDFVVRKDGRKACSSSYGRVGGRQRVLLMAWCNKAAVIHEIAHAVGLEHEHNRSDRDQYIEYVKARTIVGFRKNYIKKGAAFKAIGDYNCTSITHYPPAAAAIDKTKPNLLPKKCSNFGTKGTLNKGDIEAVAALYE